MKQSRKVRGYLNARARHEALEAQIARRFSAWTASTAPLRRRIEQAKADLVVREGRLTGGEMAAVARALRKQWRIGATA